ncbi:MAG TPA: NAD(P)H-dependent oxidoreductase [Phycisphaerales bacterium]|nr:NAD(P)H-dependent oxidoreductase [Phycisphaerales bacterium]
MPTTVAVLVGSLRKESFNRKVAAALAKLAPGLQFRDVHIGDLPLFNEDLEASPPSQWIDLRASIKAADALLFATPEYNRSVPGVLKNAIDVASRPYGQSVFDGKPGAVISASIGPLGGFGANHHLRQTLAYLNVPTMPQPEAYIARASTLFDAQGNLTDERTQELLKRFAAAFERWIEANRKPSR